MERKAGREGGKSLLANLGLSLALSRFRGLAHWTRHHVGIVVALLVNLALLLLPFYDSNNAPASLSFVSHYQNTYPVLQQTNWVGGPFVYSIWTPGYLAYVASGYSLYAAYTAEKVVCFVMLAVLAATLAQRYRSSSPRIAEYVAIFVLVNPVWLYINYVWGEWDIFPVTFLALGYAILRFGKLESKWTTYLFGAGSILIGVFFYWFPLVVIPTLLYYSRSNKERLELLVTFFITGGIVLLAVVEFLGAGLSVYYTTLASTSSILNRSLYFGLNYFVPLPEIVYLALTAFIVVLLPLFLKHWGVSEPATLFAVITLLVYTSFVPTPDNYAWAFPFAVFAMVVPFAKKVPWERLWMSLAYPLAGLVLINGVVTNSQPDGTGFFYFGYNLFNLNYVFFHSAQAEGQFIFASNVITTFAVAVSVLLVVLSSRTTLSQSTPDLAPSEPEPKRVPHARMQSRRAAQITVGIALMALVCVGSLVFNDGVPALIQYDGKGNVPIYAMAPEYIPENGNVVRPLAGNSFTEQGPQIDLSPNAPAFEFSRWFYGQGTNYSFTESLGGHLPYGTPLVEGDPFNITYLNLTGPDVEKARALDWAEEENVTLSQAPPVPLPVQGANDSVQVLDGNSTAVYGFPAAGFAGTYLAFAYNLTRSVENGTNLFHLDMPGGFVALVQFPDSLVLVHAGNSTGGQFVNTYLEEGTPTSSKGYVLLYAENSSLSVQVSGYRASVPVNLTSGGSVVLRVGVPFEPGGSRFSLQGEVTWPYLSRSPISLFSRAAIEVNSTLTSTSALAPEVSIDWGSDLGGTRLLVNGIHFSSSKETALISIGKFVSGPYELNLTFDRLWVFETAPNHYTLVPMFFFVVTPFLMLPAGLGLLFSRKPSRR